MSLTVNLPSKLSEQLQQVEDINQFLETAVRREFNRQRAIGAIEHLAQSISRRPAAKSLSQEQLDQLLNAA